MQEKLNENNIEIAAVRVDTKKFQVYTQEQRHAIVERLPPPPIAE
jgi:hypothetical protein